MNETFENTDVVAAQALAGSSSLTELLADGVNSIYHDDAPQVAPYPMIQYTTISESPEMSVDNRLYAYQKTIRVTLIDNSNVNRNRFKNLIYEAMDRAGFTWQATNTMRDGREYYLIMDFQYVVEVN